MTNGIYSVLSLSGSLPLLLSKKAERAGIIMGSPLIGKAVSLYSQASVQLGRGVIDDRGIDRLADREDN